MKLKFLLLYFALVLASPSFAQKKKNGKVTITEANGNVIEGKMKKGLKTGEWKTTNSKGEVISIETYDKGKHHGDFKIYYPGGTRLHYHYIYLNGRKNGIQHTLSPKGDTIEISTYRNDTLDGYSRTIRGEYVTTGSYVNGKKEGWWVSTMNYRYTTSTDSAFYSKDVAHGVHKTYNGKQLVHIRYFSYGVANGGDTTYYPSGMIHKTGYAKNGMRDGVHREYAESGELIRETWYNGILHAKYDSVWKMKKSKRVLEEVTLYDNQGTRMFYIRYDTDNGLPRDITYLGDDGLIDSAFEYSSGVLRKKSYYDQDKRDYYERNGYFLQYRYEKDKSYSYGRLSYHYRVGKWTWKDSSGRITKEIQFAPFGSAIRYTSYYPNGKVKITGVCSGLFLSDSIQVYTASGRALKKGTPEYDLTLAQHFKTETEILYSTSDVQVEETMQEGDDGYDIFVPAVDGPGEQVTEVLSFAEEMPKFPGDSMNSFIQHNIKYPQAEREAGKDGTVYVKFNVQKDGTVTDATVVKGVPGAPAFSAEALRVVNMMPHWEPGKMNGRPVIVTMTIPIKFRL